MLLPFHGTRYATQHGNWLSSRGNRKILGDHRSLPMSRNRRRRGGYRFSLDFSDGQCSGRYRRAARTPQIHTAPPIKSTANKSPICQGANRDGGGVAIKSAGIFSGNFAVNSDPSGRLNLISAFSFMPAALSPWYVNLTTAGVLFQLVNLFKRVRDWFHFE